MTTETEEAAFNRLIKMLEDAQAGLQKINKQFVDFSKVISPLIQEEMKALNAQKEQKLLHKHQVDLLKKKNAFDEIAIKHLQETKRLRHQHTMDEEQEHGRQVRRNIELRAAMEKTVGSFSLFSSMLGGIGLKAAGGRGLGGVMGFFGATHQRHKKADEVDRLRGLMSRYGDRHGINKLLAEHGGSYDEVTKIFQGDTEKGGFLGRRLSEHKAWAGDVDKIQAEMREEERFSGLRSHPTLAGIADKFDGLAKWADEHKGGIAVSLVSMGIFIGLLKKMLDTSPMLGKMFEMFKLMFDLTLRPFGDMIGFFLLPILRVVMATVLPMFAKLYPKLTQFGLELGNILTNNGTEFPWENILEAMGFVAGKIDIWDVLDFLMGNQNDSGQAQLYVGGLSAGVTATALAATGYAGYKTTNFVRKRLQKPTPIQSTPFMNPSNVEGLNNQPKPNVKKNLWSKLSGWKGWKLGGSKLGGGMGFLGQGIDLFNYLTMSDDDYEAWSEKQRLENIWSEDRYKQHLPTDEGIAMGNVFPAAYADSGDIEININHYGVEPAIAEHISGETASATIQELKRLRNTRYS